MSNLPADQLYIPGKAYEVLLKAPFTKSNDVMAKGVTRALAAGERRNKGRGYRVLVTLSDKKACYLAEYMHTYLASDKYGKLATADALSVRSLTTRLDEMCAPSQSQVARQDNLEKGREVAAANREAAREPKIDAAKAEAQRYKDWCKRDAFITQQRNSGLAMPREPMPAVSVTTYKFLDEHAPRWKPADNSVTSDLEQIAIQLKTEGE